MSGYKKAFFVTATVLLGSVALNVLPYLRTEPAPVVSPQASSAPTSPVATTPSARGPSPALASCRRELDKCQKATWEVALNTIRQDARSRREQRETQKSKALKVAGRSGWEEQQMALCEISKKHVRLHWKSSQKPIVATLQNLGSKTWIDKWLGQKLPGLRNLLGLDQADAGRVQQGYEALWDIHGPKLQGLITSEPPDYKGLVDAVQGFWKAEDDLIGDLLGKKARDSYRVSELSARSAIAAIMATFAGLPFDKQTLAW